MKCKIFPIFLLIFLLTGCLTHSDSFVVRFWDGYYSMESSAHEFEKKAKAFYDSEPEQTKLLRKKMKIGVTQLIKKFLMKRKKIW